MKRIQVNSIQLEKVKMKFCFLSLVLFLSIHEGIAKSHELKSQRPNIIVILADDLGYGDLGSFGHPEIKTPNLDRLASEGVKLINSYSASAVCSPSRAAIMTGRNPYRVGIYNWIPMMSPMHMPASEVTIASLLKKEGYATCMVGKWHLNGLFNLPGQPQPDDFGFDHWFAVQNNALPNHKDPYNFVRNGIPQGTIKGFSGPIVANEAIDWLKTKWNKSNPFFLYVAFNEPHEPIATDEKYKASYRTNHPNDPSRVAYYGNVTQMDAAIGRILDTMDSMKISDNTLVWFTSDNGPARTRWHNAGSTNNLREYKGHLYEGGIRVPGIIRWPREIEAGIVSKEAVSGIDILQTLCDIVGILPPTDRVLDGASILPVFKQGKVNRDKPLFWKYLWPRSKPKFALIKGPWKLLAHLNSTETPSNVGLTQGDMKLIKKAGFKDFELYNIEDDPFEEKDLAMVNADKLRELILLTEEMHAEVQDEGPVWPAWEYSRYEGARIEWPEYEAKPLKDN